MCSFGVGVLTMEIGWKNAKIDVTRSRYLICTHWLLNGASFCNNQTKPRIRHKLMVGCSQNINFCQSCHLNIYPGSRIVNVWTLRPGHCGHLTCCQQAAVSTPLPRPRPRPVHCARVLGLEVATLYPPHDLQKHLKITDILSNSTHFHFDETSV